jgi:polyisoprenoid-binding protein YceI
MLRRVVAVCFAALFAFAARADDISKDPARAPTGSYRLDTLHSQVLFSVTHMGLTDYYGRFDKISGTLSFDAGEPEKSATHIAIDMDSIDTPSSRLNDDLKDSSVFSTAQFPSATFTSTKVEKTGPDTGRITGNLTIKGVTRPVVLHAEFRGGQADPLNGNYAIGFHATTTIRRADFGITGMVWEPFVSNDVTLVIEALFEHEKE